MPESSAQGSTAAQRQTTLDPMPIIKILSSDWATYDEINDKVVRLGLFILGASLWDQVVVMNYDIYRVKYLLSTK